MLKENELHKLPLHGGFILSVKQTLAFCATEQSCGDFQKLYGFSDSKAAVSGELID